MLKKRIIPCLDVKNGVVVKGVQFRNHKVVGDIVELAIHYSENSADELVFYDITASSDKRRVNKLWVKEIAKNINIPFCVAGGIRNIADAEEILENGADKISINSPALENPSLIDDLVKRFGSQCVVVGIDSLEKQGEYLVNQYTGDESKTLVTTKKLLSWATEVTDRGAGEIVLNCMNQDGVRKGYDLIQVAKLCENVNVPVIASGGAGSMQDFVELFKKTQASGALAASVFHKKLVAIPELKQYMQKHNIAARTGKG